MAPAVTEYTSAERLGSWQDDHMIKRKEKQIMMDEQKHKVKLSLTEEVYQALLYIRVEDQDTMEGVINRAVLEYATAHYPEALKP